MSKKSKRDDTDRSYPNDWLVMHIGKPAPPGTPLVETCVLPFEPVKHLLSDRPMARYGDPDERAPRGPRSGDQ